MGHILLTRGIAVNDARRKSDIVGMLHASLTCADITDAVERISAKVLLKERNDFLDMHKSARYVVHLRRLCINLNRDVALDTVVDIFPKLVVADGKRNMVGGDFLWRVPMPSGSAVAIVKGFHVVSATDGLHVVGHSDIYIVRCFVGEIIDTREPCLTQIMRLALKAHAEVVDIVAIGPPFHAPPILAEGGSAVTHVEYGILTSFHWLVKRDRQKVTFLTETLNIVKIAGHIGGDKALQLQHDSICRGGSGKVNERLPLQCVVGEVEIPNMDFVMGHINVFAWSLGFCQQSQQQSH